MSVIYETRGRAKEFNELALNLYTGCPHGCLYCWSPSVLHIDRVKFHQGIRPRVTLAQIGEAARKLQQAGETRGVLFCFTCDPYPNGVDSSITREAIIILHAHGLKVTILTKGGRRALGDFDLLGPGDQFATTLTCIDEATSQWWEPGAAPPEERIESLVEANGRGIETWVSLEPVIYPNATKQLILLTKDIANFYRVGKLNYHSWRDKIEWSEFANEITDFMNTLGVRYYIKADLAKYLGKPEGFWNRQ